MLRQRIRKRYYKTLWTSLINSPLSPHSLKKNSLNKLKKKSHIFWYLLFLKVKNHLNVLNVEKALLKVSCWTNIWELIQVNFNLLLYPSWLGLKILFWKDIKKKTKSPILDLDKFYITFKKLTFKILQFSLNIFLCKI